MKVYWILSAGILLISIYVPCEGNLIHGPFQDFIDKSVDIDQFKEQGIQSIKSTAMKQIWNGFKTRSGRRYSTTEDNIAKVRQSSCLVNAWILLDEDEPFNTTYKSPNSSYQALIKNNVYQSVDILYICFVTTINTSFNTAPAGDGTSYTIGVKPGLHPSGLTNQDYMNYMIPDARKNNPHIKIAVTLDWSDGSLISNIFSTSELEPQEAAQQFAANLMAYLKKYNLDGFDIDWEYPISSITTQEQFTFLINAIGAEFKQQTNKHYYLTLSPAELGNLDAEAVNNYIDFVNLQLYSGFTDPDDFTSAGVNPNLLAYGTKFEGKQQTAKQAYHDNKHYYHYNIFTNWRLNSDNYMFEQTQQQYLYKLCNDSPVSQEWK